MKVAVDIDGVLGDHVLYLIEYLKRKGVVDDGFSKEHVNRWDSMIAGHGFKEIFEMHLLDREFVTNIPVIEGSVDAIREIKRYYKVIIVTARPQYAYEATVDWLVSNGFEYDEFIIGLGPERVDLDVDVLIDDNPYTVLEFVSRGRNGIIFSQPWNQSVDISRINESFPGKLVRLGNWRKIRDLLLGIRP